MRMWAKQKHHNLKIIKALEELIKRTAKDDEQLPDLIYRLSGKFGEMHRYWRFRALDLNRKIDALE